MLILSLFIYLIAALWFVIFLARARDEAMPLPNLAIAPPEYVLWLPDGMPTPTLIPQPSQVFQGPEMPDVKGHILRLAGSIKVPTNLASRCFATGHAFLSIMPRPNGGFLALLCERMQRDFAQPAWVNDAANPAAFVDHRCVWFKGIDSELPSGERCDIFRVGRARKAHGLPVGLYSGYELGDESRELTAPATNWSEVSRALTDWFRPQPWIRWLLPVVSATLWWFPLISIVMPEVRDEALLALFIGFSQRLCAALYDGFSLRLVLFAPLLEPLFWLRCAKGFSSDFVSAVPDLSEWRSPITIAPRGTQKWKWLDESMVVYSARRLGGSAKVMDILYANEPTGFTRRGAMLDGWIHQLPGARAVRFRRYAVQQALRNLPNEHRLCSLPSGTARDLMDAGCAQILMIDMDPSALAVAQMNVPHAQTFEGSFSDLDSSLNCDLFVYCGLSEYLGDHEVVAQLRHIRRIVGTEGVLITSTTQPNNQATMMSNFIGWHTRTRSEDGYRTLLELAGFRIESEWRDPNAIQVVFRASALETF